MMGVCRRCHGNTEGLCLDQRANPVLMSVSFTSKILQWKIQVLPCELTIQNETIETLLFREEYLNGFFFFFWLPVFTFFPNHLVSWFLYFVSRGNCPSKKKQKQKKQKNLKNSVELVGFLSFCYYLFIHGCGGCSLLCAGCLQLRRVGEKGLLFLAVHGLLVAVASPVVGLMEHGLQAHGLQELPGLSSRGAWAQLLRGICDLLTAEIEPMSPALAGRFFTTEPPGKSCFSKAG